MPKPGGNGKYNNKPSWKNQYMEHDFRANNNRKTNFKPHRREPGKDWSSSLRYALDDDIDMGLSSTSNIRNVNHKKNRNRGGGRSNSGPHGHQGPPQQHQKRKLLESPSNWYRITMPFGNKYDKEFLFRLLTDKVSPLILTPIFWNTSGTSATFYTEEFKMAEKLHALDRTIQMPDGYRLGIRVHSGTPNVEVTTEMKEKMKLAMAKRYNPASKALDLSRFHSDPDLRDYFCTLFKPGVFLAIVDIIGENIQDLEAISLDDNRLPSLFYAKKFTEKAPNMKILHLGKNKIRELSVLDTLSPWPIVDLVLDGNPVCGKFKDQSAYISEVRKRFPKVIKLDGVQLEPPISFDVDDNVTLPSTNQTYLCNNDGQEIVRQFLEQYFQIFDSEKRENLTQAYHQQAVFSTTVAYPYGIKDKNVNALNWYYMDNRNLKEVRDTTRRQKLLKYGPLNVVAFLQEMPATKHDIHSFTVDLTLFTPQMISLTVAGIFKEVRSGQKQSPLRYFHRTLIIVPAGSGFCIANEMLHITNCTDSQAKNAFKIPIVVVQPPTPMTSPNASLTEPPQVAAPVAIPDPSLQVQMVQALAERSNMNLEWSKKCLEETHWNFDTACGAFLEAHKNGLIPPEAFIK